ncbi:hypothetical protein [Minwuia sp.]|uniref:hypothetical protein n=1 Tax=Minwuia sp. TaxID=2493630 RepID=UPI003A922E8B
MSGTAIFRVLIVVCVLLALVDVVNLAMHVFDHYGKFQVESLPNFYGFFGLIAGVLLVLTSGWLRRVLSRDEDYYDNDVD